jgi:hypothetical protein
LFQTRPSWDAFAWTAGGQVFALIRLMPLARRPGPADVSAPPLSTEPTVAGMVAFGREFRKGQAN